LKTPYPFFTALDDSLRSGGVAGNRIDKAEACSGYFSQCGKRELLQVVFGEMK
jgi:hypothetical protein